MLGISLLVEFWVQWFWYLIVFGLFGFVRLAVLGIFGVDELGVFVWFVLVLPICRPGCSVWVWGKVALRGLVIWLVSLFVVGFM